MKVKINSESEMERVGVITMFLRFFPEKMEEPHF